MFLRSNGRHHDTNEMQPWQQRQCAVRPCDTRFSMKGGFAYGMVSFYVGEGIQPPRMTPANTRSWMWISRPSFVSVVLRLHLLWPYRDGAVPRLYEYVRPEE